MSLLYRITKNWFFWNCRLGRGSDINNYLFDVLVIMVLICFHSYSAVQEISGMEKGATAYVGCDGNKVATLFRKGFFTL
jgi:hypothetical protein